jgi:hypothetical protein
VWLKNRFPIHSKIEDKHARALISVSRPDETLIQVYKTGLMNERSRVAHLSRAAGSRMLAEAAEIVGFTYVSLSGYHKQARTATHFRKAWLKSNGNAEARMKVCFMFHFYPDYCYKVVHGYLNHREVSVEDIRQQLGITFSDKDNMKEGETNCLEQMYAKEFSQLKGNMMKKDGTNKHNVKTGVKTPKGYESGKSKNSIRGPCEFYYARPILQADGTSIVVGGNVRMVL